MEYLRSIFLFLLLSLFISGQAVKGENIYKFPSTQINMETGFISRQPLVVNLTTNEVAVLLSMGYLGGADEESIELKSEIGDMFINDNNEIVISDKQGKAIVAIYVSDDSKEGYYIYYDADTNGFYKIPMTSSESFAPNFFSLKKIVESGWKSSQQKNSNSKVSSSNNSVSENSSSTKSKKAKIYEPARSLTAEDLVRHPLGILQPKQTLWEIPYLQVREEANIRDNWEIKACYGGNDLGRSFIIYEGIGGYNMTYNREPIESVSVDAASYGLPSGNGEVEEYQYSFQRGIKNRKAKYQTTKAEREWTDQEAIAFANNLINDLSNLGIPMTKVKGYKGDILTSVGVDPLTGSKIKVRIHKAADKLFSFLSVLLEVKNPKYK